MKNPRLPLAALFAALVAATPAAAADAPDPFTQDIDAAMAYAAASGLPVMLDFSGSDWCFWCKLMDSHVFSKEEWKSWAPSNVVTALVDFPRDESRVPEKWRGRNEALAKKYAVRGFPTFVVLSPNGSEIGRLGASRGATPKSFVDAFTTLVSSAPAPSPGKTLSEEDERELAALSDKVAALQSAIDGYAKTATDKADEWRDKLLAAKGASGETLAEMRREATRDIAAAMSSAQAATAEARKQMEEATARIRELRERAEEGN